MAKTSLLKASLLKRFKNVTVRKCHKSKNKKNLGRWKALDDFLLIQGVLALNNLDYVHIGVKFSCHFTLREIKERWKILLYDQKISGLAIDSIRNLHPEMIENAERKALFSEEEEECLTWIEEAYPYVEDFESLLTHNKEIFHPTRNPLDLYNHFMLMKSYNLLPGQQIEPFMSFFDMEQKIDKQIDDNPEFERENMMNNRRCIREIRHLEDELDRWSVLVPFRGPEMDRKTLAVLQGRFVRFIMRSNKVTFGRNTKEKRVDMDFSLEGPCEKVSRVQGELKLRENGDFFLENKGKRSIIVDGEPILTGHKCKVRNRSLIEVANLNFVFHINKGVVNTMRLQNSGV